MKKKGLLRKMLSYYKPYMGVFWTDMFFATLSAAIALVLPLVVRYVTNDLIYREPEVILHRAGYIAIGLIALVAIDCYSKFYISNYGHVMGAKIEYDMRAEIFNHYQKLSFSFYDDQKVGQLMSRITTDSPRTGKYYSFRNQNRWCIYYFIEYQPAADSGSLCNPACHACICFFPEWENEPCF